jgi:signal transduction histidine kinase
LIGDLLVFGRPAALERRPTDLHQLLDGCFHLYAGEIRERSIALRKAYHPHLPTLVVDQDKLIQVILNLLKNALEATSPGGTVTVETRLHKSEGGREVDDAEVSISDTGCGILPEDRDRIFDLFFTTKPRGSGLGLPICRRIIEDHGGKLALESRLEQGATFTISLPLKPGDG